MLQGAISCLKHENHDSWPNVLEKWSVTHAFRIKCLKDSRPKSNSVGDDQVTESGELSVKAYFQEWAVLSLPNGYLLVRYFMKCACMYK